MTTPDYSHAIEQLRYLIEHGFDERRYVDAKWWEYDDGRLDIACLRSYIAAVRTLACLSGVDASLNSHPRFTPKGNG